MIARMSRTISSFFIDRGIIEDVDRDVYIYSFEILLSTLASFIVLIILSIISRTVPETALYLLGFVPLRQVAGGYHAKNHFRCFLIMLFSYTAFQLLLFFLPTVFLVPAAISSCILSIISVFVFAPSEDRNKPLSANEISRFKKNSRISIFVYVVIICLLTVFVLDRALVFSLALGVFTASLSLLANYIKCEFSKNKK